ncbi:MAG: TIGR03668 family PPOX class F420-dependent oxidoreductase [Segniliparus sp.]|uniref:TIGR03668 family PPOX class F420-dependent oxidoreductase n=1 Tax=Segniliparus sp. TaxID=2804064 RepID=UPI003F3C6095
MPWPMRAEAETLKRQFGLARVARLASADESARPHLVPVVFALRGDVVVIAVDHKPKSTAALKRISNIQANDQVSLLVDGYDDADWTRLWWTRIDGTARIVAEGADHAKAVAWLCEKYQQYRDFPPTGQVIWIEITTVRGWSHHG